MHLLYGQSAETQKLPFARSIVSTLIFVGIGAPYSWFRRNHHDTRDAAGWGIHRISQWERSQDCGNDRAHHLDPPDPVRKHVAPSGDR